MSSPDAGEMKNKRIFCSQNGRLAAKIFPAWPERKNDNYFLLGVEKKKTL